MNVGANIVATIFGGSYKTRADTAPMADTICVSS